jgi:hypothetical protein
VNRRLVLAVVLLVAGSATTGREVTGPRGGGPATVWHLTGTKGRWAAPAAQAATSAMTTWGRLLALPRSMPDGAAAVRDSRRADARLAELGRHFDLERGFGARLYGALAYGASIEAYDSYAAYELGDVTVTWVAAHDGEAFVAFSARERYRGHDGVWDTTQLRQFQVSLTAVDAVPDQPGEWRVRRFDVLPLEGEGS